MSGARLIDLDFEAAITESVQEYPAEVVQKRSGQFNIYSQTILSFLVRSESNLSNLAGIGDLLVLKQTANIIEKGLRQLQMHLATGPPEVVIDWHEPAFG